MRHRFIYGLAHSGEIRYVGLTTKPLSVRLRQHMTEARNRRRWHVHRWISSVGFDVQIIELERDPVGDLGASERAWIATLRRYGCRLTNISEGGQGEVVYGRIPWNKGLRGVSDETRARMAASARARGGRPWTEEAKAKQSELRKGAEWIRAAGRKGALVRAAKGYRWADDDPRRDPEWRKEQGRRISEARKRRQENAMSGDVQP